MAPAQINSCSDETVVGLWPRSQTAADTCVELKTLFETTWWPLKPFQWRQILLADHLTCYWPRFSTITFPQLNVRSVSKGLASQMGCLLFFFFASNVMELPVKDCDIWAEWMKRCVCQRLVGVATETVCLHVVYWVRLNVAENRAQGLSVPWRCEPQQSMNAKWLQDKRSWLLKSVDLRIRLKGAASIPLLIQLSLCLAIKASTG